MFRFVSPAGLVYGLALASILFALPHDVAATPSSESGFAAGTGEIVGEVTDPQGLLVPGADVILTLASGEIRETTSDAAGSFRFDTLPEGIHQLTVLGRGFADRTVEITVGAAGEVRISIPLDMSFAERVTVTGQQQERSLQDEPTSVALVSGAQLDAGTDTDLYRLVAMTPN
ncbi:MAG: carboxypeptidase-like regulatory domain-containing protein, partial [Acidobacteriota bacterium]|nr:carboxypeptidase-like regulatory domain-containing protein [Acidobacteriota bacterium]